MNGRLYAQCAWVAARDADAIEEHGTLERGASPATLSMPERIAEASRLRAVAERLSTRAHELGFHAASLDEAFA